MLRGQLAGSFAGENVPRPSYSTGASSSMSTWLHYEGSPMHTRGSKRLTLSRPGGSFAYGDPAASTCRRARHAGPRCLRHAPDVNVLVHVKYRACRLHHCGNMSHHPASKDRQAHGSDADADAGRGPRWGRQGHEVIRPLALVSGGIASVALLQHATYEGS